MLSGNQTDQIFFNLTHFHMWSWIGPRFCHLTSVWTVMSDLIRFPHHRLATVVTIPAERGRSLWSVSLRTLSNDIKCWRKVFTNSKSFLRTASASVLTSVYLVHCVWHCVVVPTSVFSLDTLGLQVQVPLFKKRNITFVFHLKWFLFISAQPLPVQVLSSHVVLIFCSFPFLTHRTIVWSAIAASRDTSVSHICRSELNLPKLPAATTSLFYQLH